MRENAKNYSETSGDFGRAWKNGEAFAHSDVLASRLGILEVRPATSDEHKSNRDAQKKKRDISEWANCGNIMQ